MKPEGAAEADKALAGGRAGEPRAGLSAGRASGSPAAARCYGRGLAVLPDRGWLAG